MGFEFGGDDRRRVKELWNEFAVAGFSRKREDSLIYIFEARSLKMIE